jgi:hypothetical protein
VILPLFSLAISVQNTPAAESPVQASPDIVVIARQLSNWRGRTRSRNGQIACETVRTSGDIEIDAIGCEAMLTCLTLQRASIEAVNAAANRRERRERQAQANRALGECVSGQYDVGVSALADRRAGIE